MGTALRMPEAVVPSLTSKRDLRLTFPPSSSCRVGPRNIVGQSSGLSRADWRGSFRPTSAPMSCKATKSRVLNPPTGPLADSATLHLTACRCTCLGAGKDELRKGCFIFVVVQSRSEAERKGEKGIEKEKV
jgi:hypothetical protein